MKKYLRDFLLAILAGFSIGLGGTVYLRLKDAFTGGNVVGALLFAIGLFIICTRGYNLFTGKACYIFDNKPKYLLFLAVVWIGNLCGCLLMAGLERLTGLCGDESGINVTAYEMVQSKMDSSLLSLFVLGIICNVCIFVAVNGYAKCQHELGKYLSIFLGVSVFILSGTEHSIADMYYWCISGVIFEDFGQSVLRLLVVSLGNVVGGVFFPVVEKICRRLTEEKA
ncbi:MAG: formate/nitrite transporter family protein [Oscillospiraceae bacterium]|nr:formate/nitrite transporter family protein [Oscillospiraceae bacterium]